MTKQFPGYCNVVQVGAGGLGTVYRATRQSTGGVVAIKELTDLGVGSTTWHRARRELEALLRLKGHPNVVSVEEVFDGPNGPCLVMEFASGGSLADRLVNGPLSLPELVLVGQHVTAGLTASHDLGIVHRDIKPHNLLVSSFGQVKVCDFGIAALARGSEARTQTKAMTLAYASPEEIDGSQEIGPPSDVYSFGATLFHLATGRPPTFQDRIDANIEAADRSWAQVLPVALWQVLRRCLASQPDARPTMAELSEVFDSTASNLQGRRMTKLAVESSGVKLPAQPGMEGGGPPHPASAPSTDAGKDERPLAADHMDAAPTLASLGAVRETPDITSARASSKGRRRLKAVAVCGGVLSLVAGATAFAVLTRSPGVEAAPSLEPEFVLTPPPTSPGETHSFDPTGELLLASDVRRTIVWDLTKNSLRGSLTGGYGVFSSDGSTIATLTEQRIELWNTSDLGPLEGFDLPSWMRGSSTLRFTDDGRSLIVEGGTPSSVVVWNRDVEPSTFSITDVDASHLAADGTKLATRLGDRITIWDVTSGAQIASVSSEDEYFYLSYRGDRLYTYELFDGPVSVWSAETGELLRQSEDQAHVEAILPDGERVILGSEGVLRVVDPELREELVIDGWQVYPSEDGRILAVDSYDEAVVIWNLDTGTKVASVASDGVISPTLSPDGRFVVTGDYDSGTVTLWDATNGTELSSFETEWSVMFSPDSSKLAVPGSKDDSIIVWDTTNATSQTVRTGLGAQWSATFEAEGATVVSSGDGGLTSVWDARTGAELLLLKGVAGSSFVVESTERDVIVDVGRSSEGSTVATVHRIVDGESLSLDLGSRFDELPEVTLAEDGSAVVFEWMGFPMGEISVWSTVSGQQVWAAEAQYPSLSDDGSFMGAIVSDTEVAVWDMSSGEELHRVTGSFFHGFSPDNGAFAVTNYDSGTTTVWSMTSGAALAEMKGDSPDFLGSSLVAIEDYADDQSTSRILDWTSGAALAEAPGSWTSFIESANAALVVVEDWDDRRFEILDAETGTSLFEAYGSLAGILEDDFTAVVANTDATEIRFVDIAVDEESTIPRHRLLDLDVDRDRLVAESLDSGDIMLFEAGSTTPISSLPGDYLIGFAGDDFVVTGNSDDGLVSVSDQSTGSLLFTLVGHDGYVNAIDVDVDRDLLVTAGSDGSSMIWRFPQVPADR